ncbi:MAG: nitrogenase iron-molybdenum cofactor biosynthesis protein NifN [Rhodocyclaceae bacterium]|nr:nitrogenase iron-molybdenum cofactor biosynthesis protein NifN [Rhodocyclaceae bacterium]
MAEVVKRVKPLAVNPLKVSQPLGAALAFLGLRNAIPLMHGAQGCTAFAKVFFVRHFREPIPLQTTAMDQISTIMGGDDNVLEALKTLCEKANPEIIGLATTGLTETQGADIRRLVRSFRATHERFAEVAIVPVHTPDYIGSMESGFALAVEAVIETLVSQTEKKRRRRKQVNVLLSSMHTPGDVEAIKEWIEAFGLRPIVLPDLGDSLDGHMIAAETTPLTLGGTPRHEIAAMNESLAILVVGRSLLRAARVLHEKSGAPIYHFDHLMGLDASDAFTRALSEISGQPVPQRIDRERAQLLDAMVDTHFMTGLLPVALGLESDYLLAFVDFLKGVGCEIVTAISPAYTDALRQAACSLVEIGDLEDLEQRARESEARLLIANSHAAQCAERLGIPLLRAGFPQFDWVGGYARQWVGYRGARQALFDIANLVRQQHHEIPPYRSLYRTGEPAAAIGMAGH